MIHTAIQARRPRRLPCAGGLLLALALGIPGCDSFLTTQPKGQLTTESFFQTPEQAQQATNATYSLLRDWQVHVFSWLGLTDIVSDDATKGSVPSDASFLLDIDNLTFDPGNIAFRDPWTGYYRGIYRANEAITNIANVQMDEAIKARLIGENKFLRAYFYFFLVRGWGGVPLITEPLTAGQFQQSRASADEVYTLIVQDLTDAIAVLPEKSQYPAGDLGRATRGAARALLAHVYLTRKDYPNAYRYATEVVNSGEYSLYPSYGGIFTPAGENSSESVFEVQTAALEQGGAGSQYAEVQGVRAPPNIGWGFNTPSDNLEAAYEPGDPRLQATILYPWELLPDGTGRVVYLNPSMPNNRYNQKAFTSPETPRGAGNSGVNIRRIRYSDVLLTAAEAAFQTGREGEALGYLNQVRARARGGQTVTLGFTPELLQESIAGTVLGLGAGTSRVFARYVNPASAAYAAGLRSFASECSENACAQAAVPPVRVLNIDLIQSVDGTPVATPEEFNAAVNRNGPGTPVKLRVLRLSQGAGGATTRQEVLVSTPTLALLPGLNLGGQALLDAIWHERRVELAMEQHRWQDLMREDQVRPGYAAAAMAAAGKTFHSGRDELFPIPASEVGIAGLQQNPGY